MPDLIRNPGFDAISLFQIRMASFSAPGMTRTAGFRVFARDDTFIPFINKKTCHAGLDPVSRLRRKFPLPNTNGFRVKPGMTHAAGFRVFARHDTLLASFSVPGMTRCWLPVLCLA